MLTQGDSDPYNLDRFLYAQEGVHEDALAEIHRGRKRTHWMWFVFPQLDGLAKSATSRVYAIKSLDEARAYLAHSVLGSRLRDCAVAVLAQQGRTPTEIFGYPDDMKLRSCMTLFECVCASGSVFSQVLDAKYHGQRDIETLRLLGMSER